MIAVFFYIVILFRPPINYVCQIRIMYKISLVQVGSNQSERSYKMMHDFTDQHRQKSFYQGWHHDDVRFSDLDALGHVSSIRIHEFLASCRTRLFLASLNNWPNCAVIPVLKSQTSVHDREIRFPAQLDIGITIEKWGRTSLTIAMAVFDGDHPAVLARNVFVFIDRASRQSMIPDETIKNKFIETIASL